MKAKANSAKYLEKYAETLSGEIAHQVLSDLSPTLSFQHCLAIPAYNESSRFLEEIDINLPDGSNVLVIIVINQPDTDHSTDCNQQLWSTITQRANQVITKGDAYRLVQWPKQSLYLLAVNCFTENKKLSPKHGVGLARKIACDIACHLFHHGYLQHDWVGNTDADVTLPPDYFLPLNQLSGFSAAVYSFSHSGNNNPITAATLLYEQAIHYYADGLKWAKSPYAFHTIGSCIAINLDYYMQARGFPKKAAGEDFYLLNKLAKLAPIKPITNQTIVIHARESDRAPFGTGASVSKIIALLQNGKEYSYYNHQTFIVLKNLLTSFHELADKPLLANQWFQQLPIHSREALAHLHIQSLFDHLTSQALTREQSYQHIVHWFDGFRTLRFIHELEKAYPREPLQQSIERFQRHIGTPD